MQTIGEALREVFEAGGRPDTMIISPFHLQSLVDSGKVEIRVEDGARRMYSPTAGYIGELVYWENVDADN